MLLNALNIKKEYGIRTVLNIEKLKTRDGDRIGFIGCNETGRSTFLGVLSGRIVCGEGAVKGYCLVAEIPQIGGTEDELEARLLNQLKLRDSAVKSGGEKIRYVIGAALSSWAPLLLADEPTTNLDMEGVEPLEKAMKGYRGAILMISHDRTSLNQACNQIWKLGRAAARVFDGNYSSWASRKERKRDFQEFEYQQYQKEKRGLKWTADTLQRKNWKVAKPPKCMGSSEWMLYKGVVVSQQGHVQSNKFSVMSRLEHLDKKDRSDEPSQVSMRLPDAGRIRAKNVAAIRHLTVGYGSHTVLNDVSLEIEAGKRIFITGNDGAGKSTLVKALIDRTLEAFIASEARVAYSSQDLDTLDPEETVLEDVAEDAAYPWHICRVILTNLYMTKDDMFRPVSVLSGGEKAKTALAKALVSGYSFMILDEPTSHMDVHTMEGLERLLESYDGTLLAINYDRTFISHTGDVIRQFEKGNVQKGMARKADTQHNGKY